MILITNYRWLVDIGLNLNLSLKLFFYPSIIIYSNLLLKICCENIVNITFFIKIKQKFYIHNFFLGKLHF